MNNTGTKSNLKQSLPNRFPHLPKHAGVFLITDKESGHQFIGSSGNVNKAAHVYTRPSRKRGKLQNLNPDNLEFKLLDDCKYLKPEQRKQLAEQRRAKLIPKPITYNF